MEDKPTLPLSNRYMNWKYDIGAFIKSWKSTIDLAEQFYNIHPFFFDKNRNWWMWNKDSFSWYIVDETDIMNSIDYALESPWKTTASGIKNEIIEGMKRAGRMHIPKEIKKTWVQFNRQIVDIETGIVMESTPEYFATNPIPWDIGETEDTPLIDGLFAEWVGEEYKESLYEIVAYCMLPSYPIHRIFCFDGSGCNGKGRCMALIEKFLGKNNVSSSDLESLVGGRFETTKLYRKLLCLIPETSFGIFKKTGKIKQITGEDKLSFEFKGKDSFSDYNYAKLLMATNNLPPTTDKSVGWYRRWEILSFPNQFKEGKDIIKDIPDEEYKNLAKKSIRILGELLKRGTFSNEGTWEDREKMYERTSNPLIEFIEDCCEKDMNGEIRYSEFRRELVEYLKAHKKRKLSTRDISTLLTIEGYEREKRNIRKDTETMTSVIVIPGLRWKEHIKQEQQGIDDFS